MFSHAEQPLEVAPDLKSHFTGEKTEMGEVRGQCDNFRTCALKGPAGLSHSSTEQTLHMPDVCLACSQHRHLADPP